MWAQASGELSARTPFAAGAHLVTLPHQQHAAHQLEQPEPALASDERAACASDVSDAAWNARHSSPCHLSEVSEGQRKEGGCAEERRRQGGQVAGQVAGVAGQVEGDMQTRGLPHSCFELDAQVERLQTGSRVESLETGSTRMEGLALWLHQVRLACSDALPRACRSWLLLAAFLALLALAQC